MKRPRKLKKAIKRAQFIYDLRALPDIKGMSPKEILDLFYNQGCLLYDSSKGDRPQFFEPTTKRIKMVDVKNRIEYKP